MTYDPNSPTVPEQEPALPPWVIVGDPEPAAEVRLWRFPNIYDQLRWVDKPRNRHERRAQAAKGRRG
jgi:hypothetical protein